MKSKRSNEKMKCTRLTKYNAKPYEVRAHHLACAVCVRGGCKTPPPGIKTIKRLLDALWEYPYLNLKIVADNELIRAHYLDVYENKDPKKLPKNFKRRSNDYVQRRKDLEVCRVLGIVPNTEMPAFWAYTILFRRKPTLDGLCRTGSKKSKAWPVCPHADKGYYEKIAGERIYGLREQTEMGEDLDGKGIWAMIRPRTKKDMKNAKDRSSNFILRKANKLYMRPSHLLCLICRPSRDELLIEDNLIELLRRMEENPDIEVTLTEGCCQVCDPCNEYHPGEHLCYHTHIKDSLRDLMVLERLGLPPGATLPAKKLYELVYERIKTLKEICGWRDGLDTTPVWGPCRYDKPYLDNARQEGLITGEPMK